MSAPYQTMVLLLGLGALGVYFRKQVGEAVWKTIGFAAAASLLLERRKGNEMKEGSPAHNDAAATEDDPSEMRIQAGLREVRGEYPDIPIPPLGSELHVYEGFFETFRDRVRMRAVAERADAMLRLEQQVLDQLEKYIEHARRVGEFNRSKKRNKVEDSRLRAEELELEIELEEARQKLEELKRRKKKAASASRFDALREIIERYHQKCPPGTTRASFADALDDVLREQFLDEVKQHYGDDWDADDELRRFLKRHGFRMD